MCPFPRESLSQPSTHPILLGSYRELDLHSLYHIANSHQLSILHMVIYMFPCYSLFNPPSPFRHVHKSVLYVCVSIAALQIGSSIPYIFYIYKLIYDICLSLSDLLYSLELTQMHSFLWLNNIPFYICTTASLSIHLSMDILSCFYVLS